MLPNPTLPLSGQRFTVHYSLTGTEAEAAAKATAITLEQTVEFPAELVPPGDILNEIVGRIEARAPKPGRSDCWDVHISYAVETAGAELTQILNVIFGNSSIKPGIRVESLDLPASLLTCFKGPRFGRRGLRARLGGEDRPILCTALKPMGLSASELADLAYRFALGGVDIIKDDHGLANQPFAPYEERVARCAAAVERANRETGRQSLYMPNVTAPAHQVIDRALFAKRAGAGGLLFAPGLAGFDTMRLLADDERIALPLMNHPALLGSFVTSPENGISHSALFGQIARLAGADASIFPSWGGRFSFSKEECKAIVDGTATRMGAIAPAFPVPAGGMSLERIPELLAAYGREVIFLIGGGLFQLGPDLLENCRRFARMLAGVPEVIT